MKLTTQLIITKNSLRIINLMFIFLILAISNTPVFSASSIKPFEIFDGTQYKNRPDMRKYGINNITILYGNSFWNKGENQSEIPETHRLRKLARKHDRKNQMIVLDIEHWKVQGHPLRPWIIDSSIAKYIKTFQAFKINTKLSKVGYFGGIFPISNYTASISDKNSKEYITWKSDNKKLTKLANIVDVAFPSVYTYNDNVEEWEKSFITKINNLRSLYSGKIYVFLWPQYFDHSPAPKNLQLKFIPADFWRHQLEFSQKHVDGIIIWGGWDFKNWTRLKWNEQAGWWKATKNYISDNNLK